MQNDKDPTAKSPEQLLNDLHALVAEAEKMMGDSFDRSGAADAVDGLRARFDAAQARLGDLYAGARKRVVAGAKCTDEAIRANPYQSIAIAAGLGLLVGVLVGRRSR